MQPTAEQLTEAITGAIATAPQLIDDAGWIWTDAYWPPGRNPDRPTRVAIRRDTDGDPDHVPGERLALGVGNDAARAAYTRAAVLVANAHRLAARAHAHYSGRRPPVGTPRPPRGRELAVMVDSIRRRLRSVLDAGIATIDHDDPRLDAHAAAVALVAAHAELQGVLRDDGGTKEPGGNRRCSNCGDPCSPGARRLECDKCARYRQRKGKPRAIRRHEDARRARDRRRERGEDHAENPPPRGRYVDGAWIPSEPHREAS